MEAYQVGDVPTGLGERDSPSNDTRWLGEVVLYFAREDQKSGKGELMVGPVENE